MVRLEIRKVIGDFHLDVKLTIGDAILVLFGPSGAGKTSILSSLAGLMVPDDGIIEIDGEVVFRGEGGESFAKPVAEVTPYRLCLPELCPFPPHDGGEKCSLWFAQPW